MTSLAQKIKEQRKAMALTQEQLAERLHVSRQTISHWETGRVVPDVENLHQLADALGVCFTIGEEVTEETEPSTAAAAVPADVRAEDDAEPQSEAPRSRKRWLWAVLAGVVVLLAAAAGLAAWLLQPAAMAEIIVTPQDGETHLIYDDRFGSGAGWDVPFNFENVSDVPFRIDHIECRFYEENMLWNIIIISMDQIRPHVSSEWMRKGDFPLCWPFGTDQLYLTHMECTIHGTDANGNVLRFTGRVRFLPAVE